MPIKIIPVKSQPTAVSLRSKMPLLNMVQPACFTNMSRARAALRRYSSSCRLRTKMWPFLRRYLGNDSSGSCSSRMCRSHRMRSTSTAWRGATFEIGSWHNWHSMRRRLWRCRRCSYPLPRMRRDRRCMRKWWRGSVCWDQERKKSKCKDPASGIHRASGAGIENTLMSVSQGSPAR